MSFTFPDFFSSSFKYEDLVNFSSTNAFIVYCLENFYPETHADLRQIVISFITRDQESIEDFILRSSLVDEDLSNLRECLSVNNGNNLECFLEKPSFNKDLLLDISQSKAFHEHCFKRLSIDSSNDCIRVFFDFLSIDNNPHQHNVSSDTHP
jgi:hypothetical protein